MGGRPELYKYLEFAIMVDGILWLLARRCLCFYFMVRSFGQVDRVGKFGGRTIWLFAKWAILRSVGMVHVQLGIH